MIERKMRIIKYESDRADVCLKLREYVSCNKAGLDARSACSNQQWQYMQEPVYWYIIGLRLAQASSV